MPIHFLHRSVSFEELCALYAVSDACLVTSTRDGMNLVSCRDMTRCTATLTLSAGVLRVHCVPGRAQRRHDPVRVCWRCPVSHAKCRCLCRS
jgi:hypothetical protein